jgi:multiple antibiotic resistance protein
MTDPLSAGAGPSALEGLRYFLGIVVVAVGALLPIVDPLGGAPFYLAATTGLTPEQQRATAKAVAIYSFALLAASIFAGAYVLAFFGLSIPAVQVGGGLVVCAIAWALLNSPSSTAGLAGKAPAAGELEQRAFYPLTMPLTVGPGSISVALTLGANPEHAVRPLMLTALGHLLGVVIVALSVYLCYRFADRILHRLGPTGTSIVVRLSAFILLCIGVQICWNGVRGLVATAFPAPVR